MKRIYASVPFDWRSGRVYRQTRQLIAETETLDARMLKTRQLDRLRVLLRHAQANVPYYHDAIRRAGVRVNADSLDEEFQKLPLVAKATLQEQPKAFQATAGVGETTYKDNTGGSSGTPFEFIKNNSMYPQELAYMMAQWERVGYRPGDPKLTLRGRTFAGRAVSQRWAYNPIYNELVLSSYHLDADTIAESLQHVRRFGPRFIHGYPSAIVTFLRGVVDAGLELPQGIQAVLCGSEPTYEFQREFIRRTLGCGTYTWYGQSECVLLAGECEHSSEYHSFPLYGVLELVDGDGQPIREPGIEGEIVGTSLNNWAMPFLRYRTGDRGIYSSQEPCSCGRAHPRLAKVTGRQQHFIFTRHNTPVPVTAFIFGQHFDAFRRMCAMQLVQDEPGELLVRIVRGKDFSESDECELRTKMQHSVDDELTVRFEYPDTLPVNAAGKTDFVVQNVQLSKSLPPTGTTRCR